MELFKEGQTVTSKNDYLLIEPSDRVWLAARRRDERTPQYKSHTNNTRRLAAFVVEELVARALGVPLDGENETKYDIEFNGAFYDCKTTFRRGLPMPYYENNITASGFKWQNTLDFYIFADVNWEGTQVAFTGIISKEEFKRKKIEHKKDTLKNPNSNGKKAIWPADYYSVEIANTYIFSDEFKQALQAINQ